LWDFFFMPYRVTPELVPGPTLVWPEKWVPGIDTFTSRMALPNGIYVKQHRDGRVHLVARIQAGRITEFLTLYEKDMLGYFDEGGSAQTFYGDGRMEDFQARGTDSPAYEATTSFQGWVKAAIKTITRPLPEGPDALHDPGLALRCKSYFSKGPYEPNPMLNHALLDVLRSILFLNKHKLPPTQQGLYEEFLNRAAMPEEWARMLAQTLPMMGACLPKKPKHPLVDPGVYWEPVWQGPMRWQSTPVLEHPLVAQFLTFQKDFGERELLRKYPCPDPLVILHPAPEPPSEEEALERARELLGEDRDPEPLARALRSTEVAFP